MPYTLADYQAAALHAAGRSSVDTGNSTTIMVNQAKEEVVSYAPWSWRHKSTTLSFTASQSNVALPSDFGELRYVRGGAALPLYFEPASLDRIFQLRQDPSSYNNATCYLYAVQAVAQAIAAANPTYRLELYPTPGASTANAIQLQYLRIIPDLSGSTDRVDAPAPIQACVMSMVRGFAEFYELNAPGPNWALAHEQLARLWDRDRMLQPVMGKLRGTVQEPAAWADDMSRRFATDTPVPIS